MAERRKGLGRGLGALFPEEQRETKSRAIDVFFTSPERKDPTAENEPVTDNDPDDVVSAEPQLAKADGENANNASGAEAVNETEPPKKKSRRTSPSEREAKLKESRSDKAAHTAKQEPAEVNPELVPVPGATFGEVRLAEIVPNTRQPREFFDEDELNELADSIREVGILQPIVIRPLPEAADDSPEAAADSPEARYELIMGERRWRASQIAGEETIPAIIRHTEDSDLLRDALLENLHRSNLNPLEEAAAYQQLLNDFQCTQEELSKRIARSRPQISNTLRLLNLPPLVQRRVAADVLSAGHARALLGLKDPAAMERLAQRIVAESLSVRQVEEIVAVGDDTAPARARGSRRGRHEEELNALALRLSDRFNTRVKVNLGVTKGKIAIEFATIEDLNRILGHMDEDTVEVSD